MRKVYIQSTLVNTTRLDTAGAMLNQRLSRCASTPPAQHQCIVRTKSHAKINNISLEVFAEYFAALNKQDNEENDS